MVEANGKTDPLPLGDTHFCLSHEVLPGGASRGTRPPLTCGYVEQWCLTCGYVAGLAILLSFAVPSLPMGAAPGWYPNPSQRWSGVNWVAVLAGVVGTIVMAFIVGVALLDGDSPGDEREAVSPERTSSAPRKSGLPGSPIPPSPGEAYEIGGFGSPWLSGIYEAPGGPGCSWVVQRDLVGDASSVIRSGSAPRVGLRDGEYFTSDGCGTWHRVGRI